MVSHVIHQLMDNRTEEYSQRLLQIMKKLQAQLEEISSVVSMSAEVWLLASSESTFY